MGRDIPSRVAPSENEIAVEIGAPLADDETMTSVPPVALDDEHVSPELALVDSDLADRLRVALPEPKLERRPGPRVEQVVHLRLAPPQREAPDVVAQAIEGPAVVREPELAEEREPVAAPRIIAEAVEDADVVLAPVVAAETEVVAGPRIVAEDPAEPDVLDSPKPLLGYAAPIVQALAPELSPKRDLEEHDQRPVDLGPTRVVARELSPTVPVARPSSGWPDVPEEFPGRPRLRRMLFVLGLGLIILSVVIVGVITVTGASDPPPLTVAGPSPEPDGPQGSSQAQSGGSKPAAPPSAAAPKPSTPAAAKAGASRRLAWAPVDGATAYRVELFRGDQQILRETTRGPAIDLPAEWKHQGRTESLTPGTYRWYVWPVLASGPAAKAVVQAELAVP